MRRPRSTAGPLQSSLPCPKGGRQAPRAPGTPRRGSSQRRKRLFAGPLLSTSSLIGKCQLRSRPETPAREPWKLFSFRITPSNGPTLYSK